MAVTVKFRMPTESYDCATPSRDKFSPSRWAFATVKGDYGRSGNGNRHSEGIDTLFQGRNIRLQDIDVRRDLADV